MAPGGRAPGLPCGRLHEKQLLAGCMKAALLAAKKGAGWGGGGGGGGGLTSHRFKQKKKKGEIRRGEESQNRKRWERRFV